MKFGRKYCNASTDSMECSVKSEKHSSVTYMAESTRSIASKYCTVNAELQNTRYSRDINSDSTLGSWKNCPDIGRNANRSSPSLQRHSVFPAEPSSWEKNETAEMQPPTKHITLLVCFCPSTLQARSPALWLLLVTPPDPKSIDIASCGKHWSLHPYTARNWCTCNTISSLNILGVFSTHTTKCLPFQWLGLMECSKSIGVVLYRARQATQEHMRGWDAQCVIPPKIDVEILLSSGSSQGTKSSEPKTGKSGKIERAHFAMHLFTYTLTLTTSININDARHLRRGELTAPLTHQISHVLELPGH